MFDKKYKKEQIFGLFFGFVFIIVLPFSVAIIKQQLYYSKRFNFIFSIIIFFFHHQF